MRRKKRITALAIMIICLVVGCWVGNNWIGVTEIEVVSDKMPKEFDGYRIVQVSDLHNEEFGDKNDRLIRKIKNTNADCIVITGDLIDGNRTNLEVAVEFVKQAAQIAPTYFVSGNHEGWSGVYEELREGLKQAGVRVLENESVELQRGDGIIQLIGIKDPTFDKSEYSDNSEEEIIKDSIETATKQNGEYKILLSHRPELLDTYVDEEIDLVLSGHAHGGQFRLPFVGGLVAPDQGVFPKLTEGVHKRGNTTMVVSRGLGNSIIPIRIFNHPELICITLKK